MPWGSTVNSQLVHMVRIPSFHLGEPGSIPGLGMVGGEYVY